MSTTPNTDPIRALEANCALREELGDDFRIAELITEEKIVACEALLDEAVDHFFIDAEQDLMHFEQLLLAMPALEASGAVDRMKTHIYSIKSLAKVLGFTLITEVCFHLLATLGASETPTVSQQTLMKKLSGTLRLAFTHRIGDSGGGEGEALLKDLRAHLARKRA